MGACFYGAQPTPAAADQQHWLASGDLPLEITALVQKFVPNALVSFAASLVDMNALCAENPDPPAPLSLTDILEQTAAFPLANQLAQPKVLEYLYQWLRYEQFRTYCVCKAPPPPVDLACPYSNATLTVPGNLGTSPPVPYEIPEDVYASWPKQTAGSTVTWFYAWSGSLASGVTASNQLFVEYEAGGSWFPIIDLVQIRDAPLVCGQHNTGTSQPLMPRIGNVRLSNHSTSTHTAAGLNICFCGFPAVIPPQPTQPTDFPTAPAAPLRVCSTDDLCKMIEELSHRLTFIATQISDIQAELTTTSVLRVLSSQPISGEGEVSLVLATRAVSVELTHVGEGVFTSALGRPRGLMRAGSIRFGDGVGYSARQFIDADRFDRDRPEGALTISWQLINDCTANLLMLG